MCTVLSSKQFLPLLLALSLFADSTMITAGMASKRALAYRYQLRSVSMKNQSTSRMSSFETPQETPTPPPTKEQLRNYAITKSIPMVGFGFMDQTVMLHAGNAIDCSLGVTFGLSTLAAAALGQVVSAAVAAIFGGTMDDLFRRLGLPRSGLTSAQRSLDNVKRLNVIATTLGVVAGCILGLVNLLFIDTDHASILKFDKISETSQFDFEVEASNATRKDATSITLVGPDVKGLLAAVTSSLAQHGCDLMEVHAQLVSNDENDSQPMVHDVLVVQKHGHQIPNEELRDLATSILEATTSPVGPLQAQAQAHEIKELNEKVQRLEKIIQESQIRVVPSHQEHQQRKP